MESEDQFNNSTNCGLWLFNKEAKVTKIVQAANYTLADSFGEMLGILGQAIGASSLSYVE